MHEFHILNENDCFDVRAMHALILLLLCWVRAHPRLDRIAHSLSEQKYKSSAYKIRTYVNA